MNAPQLIAATSPRSAVGATRRSLLGPTRPWWQHPTWLVVLAVGIAVFSIGLASIKLASNYRERNPLVSWVVKIRNKTDNTVSFALVGDNRHRHSLDPNEVKYFWGAGRSVTFDLKATYLNQYNPQNFILHPLLIYGDRPDDSQMASSTRYTISKTTTPGEIWLFADQ